MTHPPSPPMALPSATEPLFQTQINGRSVGVGAADASLTVLQYLRKSGLTGSKEGCAEGDCGACSAILVAKKASGDTTYRAINTCITLMPMLADQELITVEGIGNRNQGYHPVQGAMAEHYGSQCGYCTPGFVASMFEAYYRDDLNGEADISDQLCGNLCRCTGYRPIRDAMGHALTQKQAGGDSDLFQLRLKKDVKPLPKQELNHMGGRFFRPATVGELLCLRKAHPKAALVAGATEIGVEINKQCREFPTLISTEGVAELRAVRCGETHYEIGGAATLTEMEEGLAGELPAIHKMLKVFASRQIRNRATLAGNLVTASPIGDLAPLLLALDAEVELGSEDATRSLPLKDFFLGYRKTALAEDEVLLWVKIPRTPAGVMRHFESYKVSKRRELDISIVAAGFCVDTDADGVIQTARLAYGGVAATPILAEDVAATLVGEKFGPELAKVGAPLLLECFSPLSDVRSGKDFRAGLCASLFEKFVCGETSLSQDEPLDYVPATTWQCGDPSRDLRHESALGHASGDAHYVDDAARAPHALTMWPIYSPAARGKLSKLDLSEVANAPGISLVLEAKDIPHTNDVGAIRQDEPLLSTGEVNFHGQLIAVVVGESETICQRAAQKAVIEVETEPPILSAKAAKDAGSYHTEAHVISRGNADKALAEAPQRLQGEMEIGGQEHFYLEAHAASASLDDDGGVTVHSSTQHPSEVQAVVSHVLGIGRHLVTVKSPRMGGGFGGKETQGNTWAALVALAAKRLGRPVRVQLDRDMDMLLTGKRHPFHAAYDVGFDAEGRILAASAELVSNGGWALDLSESICDRALFHLDSSYFIPNVRFQGRVGKTNTVSHTAFRGFGGPQGMVAMEEIIDRVARAVGKPAAEVRRKNLYSGHGETNTTHFGQALEPHRLTGMWDRLLEASEFEKRQTEIHAYNRGNSKIKRGISITPVKFGISFTASFLNQAGALLLIYRDGTVQVNHGGTEMGQGLFTKMQGIVMRELGIGAERVRMMHTQTDKVPNTSATAASSGADLNGAAVKDACDTLRGRLAPVAEELLAAKGVCANSASSPLLWGNGEVWVASAPEVRLAFAQVVEAAYMRQISLSTTGFYRTPELHYDKVLGRGRPFHYFAYGVAVSEVEVDGYSGMKRVLRVDILHDVGDSLNHNIDRGQVEGAFVQGMGWLTGEELLWSEKGQLLSHSASTYQIPAISDAPRDFRVHLLPKAPQPNTIHGSKAVGEPPFMLAISVREAIREAVAAFGEGGDVTLGCPATHEAIFHAIQKHQAAE